MFEMKTRIIVDSTTDLTPEVKSRVSLVPLTVHFGDEEYIDGVTIDHRSFYEKLVETDVHTTTSQAAPAAFMAEYEKARAAGDSAVVITISAKLSGEDYRVYTLLGDGEIQEGQVWEASMLAAHRKLDNLVVTVDNNNIWRNIFYSAF